MLVMHLSELPHRKNAPTNDDDSTDKLDQLVLSFPICNNEELLIVGDEYTLTEK